MSLTRPLPLRPAARALSPRFALLAASVSVFFAFASPFRARPQQQQSAATPSRAADEVRLVVTVTDGKGRHLIGLDRAHFSVLEGKVARPITAFEGADVPASVGVIVDVSESMIRSGEAIRLALGRLVLRGHPETQYFVAEFNTQGRLLTDWTRDPARLEGAIREIGATLGGTRTKGNTALYDACNSALARLARGAHAKRVLLVVTDGQDNNSRTTFRELRQHILASDVLIYGLGPVDIRNLGSMDVGGQAVLDELATQSGGRAYFPEGRKAAVAAAELIAAELRHQYVIGFAPGGAAAVASEPKWRRIKINVTPPSEEVKSVKVRSREGYFFPRPAG